jgi:hypothetical protein
MSDNLKTCQSLNGLKDRFRKKVEIFQKEIEKYGVFIVETTRNLERQQYLYKEGYSRVDGVHQKSLHQLGLAVDIAFKDDPRTEQIEKQLYPADMKKWREVADIGKALGIDWGYDLWNWDKPHFQDNFEEMPEKKEISGWARDAVDFCIKNKIATHWEDPQRIVATTEAAWMLKNAGFITTIFPKGLTKEQFAAFIFNISKK